jgi:hemolysin D
MLLFLIALVWSIFGKVDIVAVAPGRIIVGERTKVIQALEASVVRRVLVKDGDKVTAGQVLVELDPTIALADKVSVEEQLKTSGSEVVRTQALLQALASTHAASPVLALAGAPLLSPSEIASAQAQLLAEWHDINGKLAKLDAEGARHQAEVGTVKASISKLEALVPMAQNRESDYKKLVDQGYVSNHLTQDKTRERVEMERDLITQRARLQEVQSTLRETEQARASFKAETMRLLSDRQAQANSKRRLLLQEQAKAGQRERQTQLVAPVAGVIQQLAVHSVGSVVTSAQPLMIVVPDAAQVTAEISIANQDIGFVNAGQIAEVKLETFSYTKYGTVTAKVDMVTADAVTDEKKGSFYPATLTLSKNNMLVDGKRVNISPGMNITAEIKTGQRRVIEYLLSPVQRAGNESLRER